MNIKDLMIKDAMIMDLQATDKKGAIDEMVQKCLLPEESQILKPIKRGF